MDDEVKQRLQSTETWKQAFLMFLFIFVQGWVKFLIVLLAMFQFGSTILAGQVNSRVLKLGRQLAMYDYQINLFLTFNSEDRPFPFSSWPAETRNPGPAEKQEPVDKQDSQGWFQ
ncbi:MAG: DUF4389 domain-containing protein [Nitrosomonas sp.]|uniref:DUF4389 domain-containing protein n=1 Tax=Nitrosomonas sp. TaxID=42353 RepID=UPI00256398FF|nr:DUF4389 domain-containing protein [Nitrosomonas sp.]MBE7526149.1 DUF4389 domain-containing protein [Burkholderiales bacterium]MCC6161565.1 DUF4389 domain-containing protein [Nitrosomonas sp.]MDL1865933.1 DUF4389 domain-containing protein [Betaproteobacteria bacterium PRO4]